MMFNGAMTDHAGTTQPSSSASGKMRPINGSNSPSAHVMSLVSALMPASRSLRDSSIFVQYRIITYVSLYIHTGHLLT
jgi:hypothetical protein